MKTTHFKTTAVFNATRAILRPAGSLALLALASAPVLAQQEVTKKEDNVERIQITGSSIKRTNLEGSLPITVFSKADIDAQGITSAEQLLMNLNIASNGSDNLASNSGITSDEQRGNNGASGANLRNQGADATLVLLNGRRIASHGLKGRAVDLNSIPFAALDRVEVLRDGASAMYGTDAIGGVINFITKKDFEGLTTSAFADATEAGGGNIYRFSLVGGKGELEKDGYNLFASVGYKQNKILRGSDRDFTSTFKEDRGLSPDTRGTPFATVFNRPVSTPTLIGNGLTDPAGGGLMQAINILNLPGGAGCDSIEDMGAYAYKLWNVASSKYACAWDYPRAQVIQQPQDSLDLVSRATFQVSDEQQAYIEFVGSDVDVRKSFEPNQISPGTVFNASSWYPSTGVAYESVYKALGDYFGYQNLNYGAPIAYRWRCMECGNREIETNTKSYRLLLGTEGVWNNFDYNFGISRSQNESESYLASGYHYQSALVAALGSGHINPFLMPGQSQSAEGMALLAGASADGVTLYGGRTLLTQIDGTISGDSGFELYGGNALFAVGFDLRREEYKFDGDRRTQKDAIFNAPFDDQNAVDNVSRDIKAVFVETMLPVMDDLEVTLAGRYDSYDGFGSTTNPKLGFKYEATEGLLFRGAYSTGFKVPTFNQLFQGETITQYTGLDMADPKTCPSGRADETKPGCESIRPVEITGGKTDLRPEESDQKSFGFVWDSGVGFNMSMDWWEIERTDTIRPAARETLIKYYDLLQDNWIRDQSGAVVAIDRRYINSGGSLTQGIELDANYVAKLESGILKFSLNGSYISSFKSKGLDILPYTDNLVGEHVRYYSIPLKWKHTLSVAYDFSDWSVMMTQLYRDGYKDELPVSVAGGSYTPLAWDPNVDTYITYNASATYTGFKNWSMTAGIKNLLDEDPPFTAHQNDFSAGAAWEPRVADPRGRAYTVQVDYKF